MTRVPGSKGVGKDVADTHPIQQFPVSLHKVLVSDGKVHYRSDNWHNVMAS